MKTVLVTGGNRGIGFEVCRQLDLLGFRVILGTRNLENGKLAAKTLSDNVIVRHLDVTNEETIIDLFNFISKDIGKLDVLINNAGLGPINLNNPDVNRIKKVLKQVLKGSWNSVKKLSPIFVNTGILPQKANAGNISIDGVKRIMDTNLYGAWRMIQVFTPLLLKSNDARIINVSSGVGELKNLSGIYPAYSLSKASLNAITIMFANELKEKNVKVNAVCPGWVKTDMGGPDAPRTLEEGADTIVWMATEEDIPTGKFIKDRQIIDW